MISQPENRLAHLYLSGPAEFPTRRGWYAFDPVRRMNYDANHYFLLHPLATTTSRQRLLPRLATAVRDHHIPVSPLFSLPTINIPDRLCLSLPSISVNAHASNVPRLPLAPAPATPHINMLQLSGLPPLPINVSPRPPLPSIQGWYSESSEDYELTDTQVDDGEDEYYSFRGDEDDLEEYDSNLDDDTVYSSEEEDDELDELENVWLHQSDILSYFATAEDGH